MSASEFHQKLVALFKEYHVPYKKGANALGLALAEGLNDAFKDVEKAAKALAAAILDQFSKIKIVLAVDLSVKGGKPPGKQHGGPVSAGSPYIVGERGPEMFIPNSSGRIIPNNRLASGRGTGAAPTINVHVSGSVIAERDLVRTIRDALVQDGRRTGGNLLGGYA